METLLALLAVPGVVMTLQAAPVPESWFKFRPLGCPLCLTALSAMLIAIVTTTSDAVLARALQAFAGVAVGMLVAAAAPWLFRWDASGRDDPNP